MKISVRSRLWLVALLLAPAGCRSAGAVAIQRQILVALEELNALLEGIHDEASYLRARTRIDALDGTIRALHLELLRLPRVEGLADLQRDFAVEVPRREARARAALRNVRGSHAPELIRQVTALFDRLKA